MEKNEELFIADEHIYGSEYRSHLFEQYRLYVESVEKTSDRRQHAIDYFIGINTALLSVIGLSFQIKNLEDFPWVRSVLSVVGILVAVIFWYLIRSYKQLNTGKFTVLHQIEEHLPLALYKYEWGILGKGNDKKTYFPFSHIELWMPWAFGLVYFFLGVIFVV